MAFIRFANFFKASALPVELWVKVRFLADTDNAVTGPIIGRDVEVRTDTIQKIYNLPHHGRMRLLT
jgi:hypothetical protein